MVRVEEDEVEGDLGLRIARSPARGQYRSRQMAADAQVLLDRRQAAERGMGPDVAVV